MHDRATSKVTHISNPASKTGCITSIFEELYLFFYTKQQKASQWYNVLPQIT